MTTKRWGMATMSMKVATVVAGVLAVGLGSVQSAGASGAGDEFTAAADIGALPFDQERSTAGATREPGEPMPCGDIGSTVWYRYRVAPLPKGHAQGRPPGALSITSAGSDFDTVLAVYEGNSLGGLTMLDCDDDSARHLQSIVGFTAVEGKTYYIQAGGWLGETGTLRLRMSTGANAATEAEDPLALSFGSVQKGAQADASYQELETRTQAYAGAPHIGGSVSLFVAGSVRVEDGTVKESDSRASIFLCPPAFGIAPCQHVAGP